MDKYGTELQQVFNYYSSFGSFSNTHFLKLINFTKLIKEAELLLKNKNNILNESDEMEKVEQYGIHIKDLELIIPKISNYKNNLTANSNNASDLIEKRSSVDKQLKLDFKLFLKSIEILAQFIFPKKDTIEAIEFICFNHIIPLIKKSEKNNVDVSILKEKTTNNNLIDISNLLHRTFLPIYNFYADKKSSFLSFEMLLK